MAEENVRPRVHYELEPWNIERRGASVIGFAIGPAEARAASIDGLNAKFRRVVASWGHTPTYFVNRVTTERVAEVARSEFPEPTLDLPGGVEVSFDLPDVGAVDVAYVVRDLTTLIDLDAYADFGPALVHAQVRASSLRPIAIDLVVTERLALIEPGVGDPRWAMRLVERSSAPAVMANEARRRLATGLAQPRPSQPPDRSL